MNDHVTEIVRYDDHRSSIRNRILFHKPTQNSPDEDRGCSMYTGHEKIFDMVDRVKGRTNNSEGTGGTWMYQSKRKKKNLRQTRAMPCVRFRFLPAEMGECHSCTQHSVLLKTTILYLKKSYMSMVYHQSSHGSIQTTVNNSTINCLPYSNTKWNCNISNNSQMLNNTLVNLMKKWFSGRRNITGP